MKFGEIYWVDLPERGGREQRGPRPAVVWQDMDAFPSPTAIVIPLTTRTATTRFPGTQLLQPSTKNGLKAPSVALVFQLGACDLRRFGECLGELDPPDLAQLQTLAKKLQKLA